jgi:uncharacterized protein DUF1615
MSGMRTWWVLGTIAVLAGCATLESLRSPQSSPERRAASRSPVPIVQLIPARVTDRRGWADDMQAAMLALGITPNAENVCAVVAVIEQESSFRVDPGLPGLGAMARQELERRREGAGIPGVVVQSALKLVSSDGRSYNERLDTATTERQLSDLFEDFAGRVPLGRTLFAGRNPVRTAGPMQVSIPFAQQHAAAFRYPWPMAGSIRDEVFTRRGGLYFGIAHLLHYPAPYDDMRYRFADFNAGRYSSRNAAFQKAVSELADAELAIDGDLLRYDQGRPTREVSRTEVVTRQLAKHFEMTEAEVRRDLELGQAAEFERSRLYLSVFTLMDGVLGKPAPRAVVPTIVVETFKTTRKLTSSGYAARVAGRYKGCLSQL